MTHFHQACCCCGYENELSDLYVRTQPISPLLATMSQNFGALASCACQSANTGMHCWHFWSTSGVLERSYEHAGRCFSYQASCASWAPQRTLLLILGATCLFCPFTRSASHISRARAARSFSMSLAPTAALCLPCMCVGAPDHMWSDWPALAFQYVPMADDCIEQER